MPDQTIMKSLFALIKNISQVCAITALTVVFMFLAEDFIKEVKTYEEPDYADVKGCDPDVWYEYQACG